MVLMVDVELNFYVCGFDFNLFQSMIIWEEKVYNCSEEFWCCQECLEVVLEVMNMGLWEWDLMMCEMYFSLIYFMMLGWEFEEFLVNQEIWMSMVYLDDWLVIYMFFYGIVIFLEDIVFSYEYCLCNKFGVWCWFFVCGKIVCCDEQGCVCCVVGVYIDIIECKMEER